MMPMESNAQTRKRKHTECKNSLCNIEMHDSLVCHHLCPRPQEIAEICRCSPIHHKNKHPLKFLSVDFSLNCFRKIWVWQFARTPWWQEIYTSYFVIYMERWCIAYFKLLSAMLYKDDSISFNADALLHNQCTAALILLNSIKDNFLVRYLWEGQYRSCGHYVYIICNEDWYLKCLL